MAGKDTDVFLQLLQDLKLDVKKIDDSVDRVWSTTSSIKSEMKGIKETMKEQRDDIRTLFENQNAIKSNVDRHDLEIDHLKDDTQSIKVNKQSKTSLMPLPRNGWKSSVVKMLPWLLVAMLLGAVSVGMLINGYYSRLP